MAHKGESLQNYNNQLVETLQGLKDEREALHSKIESSYSEQRALEHRAVYLSEQLAYVNENIRQKHETRSEYDRAVQETEAVYLEILGSSQSLLHAVKHESSSLNK